MTNAWRSLLWVTAVIMAAACSKAPHPSPNVLLITLDTVRADHISAYGKKPGLTPQIDALAARGVRFERCAAPAPITLPSHVSILTGQYPVRHGVRDNSVYTLSESAVTLAELLADRGYRTGASVSCIAVSHRFGVRQGFEEFNQGRLIIEDGQEKEGGLVERDGAEITEETIRFIEKAAQDPAPFFFWAHYFDPHEPYNWHLNVDPGTAKTAYESEIRYVDHQVGEILAALKAQGIAQDTVVVVTADHGEGLGQHDERSHLLLTYETTLSVPLVVAGSGIAQGRVVENCLSRLVDLMPTVMERVGLDLPADLVVDGESLLPFCAPGTPPDQGPEIAYFETMGPVSFDWSPLDGVTTLEWKYIRGPTDELFYLPDDPDELRCLAAEKAETVERLQKTADAFASISSETGEVCEMAGRQSELFGAIGYLSLDARARRPSKDAPHPKEMVRVLDVLNQAQGAYVMHRFDQALPLYQRCALLSPGTAMFHDFLGKTKRKLGDDQGAVESFRTALSINPDLLDLRLLLGITLQNLNDLAGAEKELREVIRRAPELRKGYGFLASLLHQQGRYMEELRVIEALLKNVTFESEEDAKIFREQRKNLKQVLRR